MKNIISEIKKEFELNEGKIYSINDFYYLGTKNTIKSALFRLEKKGEIHRIFDGLYVNPYYSELIKEYSYPTPDEIARKIADKFSWNICEDNDKALNLLGLSTQVPNKYIYVSDGPYRKYNYRGREIIFKHTNDKIIFQYSREFALMIIAIKAIGKQGLSDRYLRRLSIYIKEHIKEDLEEDTLKLPFWIRETIMKIKETKDEQIIKC